MQKLKERESVAKNSGMKSKRHIGMDNPLRLMVFLMDMKSITLWKLNIVVGYLKNILNCYQEE